MRAGDADATQIANSDAVEEFLDSVKDREAFNLKEMYFESKKRTANLPHEFQGEANDSIACRIISEWQKLDKAAYQMSSLQEEQEREVAHEIEQEGQVQRPMRTKPRKHSIHETVRHFVRTGSLAAKGDGLRSLFETLRETSAANHDIPSLETRAFASEDFVHAVKIKPYDDYLRPVHWVLTGKGSGCADLILISPFEANQLLPMIRESPNVDLHVYAPRTSKSMISFSRLDFLSTSPDHLTLNSDALTAVNLFAGMLYFDSFQDYQKLCDFCGLIGGTTALAPMSKVSTEGFVYPASRGAVGWSCAFQKSPLPLIKVLLGMRRKGDDWSMTHIGQIVDGRILKEDAFQT